MRSGGFVEIENLLKASSYQSSDLAVTSFFLSILSFVAAFLATCFVDFLGAISRTHLHACLFSTSTGCTSTSVGTIAAVILCSLTTRSGAPTI